MSQYLEPKRPIPMEGWGKRHKRQTQPLETGVEYGYLTCLGQVADGTYSRFRCRCGAEFMREHRNVRKAVTAGTIPTCPSPDCRKRALAEKASLQTAAE